MPLSLASPTSRRPETPTPVVGVDIQPDRPEWFQRYLDSDAARINAFDTHGSRAATTSFRNEPDWQTPSVARPPDAGRPASPWRAHVFHSDFAPAIPSILDTGPRCRLRDVIQVPANPVA